MQFGVEVESHVRLDILHLTLLNADGDLLLGARNIAGAVLGELLQVGHVHDCFDDSPDDRQESNESIYKLSG